MLAGIAFCLALIGVFFVEVTGMTVCFCGGGLGFFFRLYDIGGYILI